MLGNLLIVDDEPANLALLENLLENEGFEVRAATSGPRALEVMAVRAPELILLDINMPEMDGVEVCRRLKAEAATAAIPVLFLSALADTDDKLRAFAAGGLDYITKPFAVAEVLARVRTHLRLYQIERDLQAEVHQAVAELRHLNAALERRVADRTAELSARTAELQTANAALQRAMRAKDEFLSAMSHDLRSPLNAILVTIETLEDGLYEPLRPEQRPPLRAVAESGQHLLGLINDILDLAKSEAGKVELTLGPVVVEEVCQASLRLIQELALKKQLTLTARVDPRVGVITADERRLKQILVNLLSNAVKFTPRGGEIGLVVAGQEDTRIVSFTVWDSGVGIAPEDLQQLFKPFVQLDNPLAREQAGTGLGLALVKNLAVLHGGSVSVDSTIGLGSRFTVSLPWSLPSAAGVTAPQAKTPLPRQGQGQLILLAEDSEPALVPLAAYLQGHGYQVVVARHGKEAIDLALEKHPTLILMDIQMPKMDGLEAIRQLRARPDMTQIPIIALTALAMPGDREHCLAAGANDYLAKPVSLLDLMEKITALVGGSDEAGLKAS